jgi:hypothetical protein
MRCLFLLAALLLLTHCAGISDYSPDTGSRTSLTGNQGGTGVQAPFWSSDPSQKTLTNHNGTP